MSCGVLVAIVKCPNPLSHRSCKQAPASKRKIAGNLEFAVRGGIDDLPAAWAELTPRLAVTYPFELDTFQKEAVLHLENGRSVSVIARS